MEDRSPSVAAPPPTSETIRLRAILLGLGLAWGICALTPFNNMYRQATPLGGGHFPLAPFFIFVWMALVVFLLRKLTAGRTILTGRELLVSWIMMVIVSGIAYTGLVRTFFINITAPFQYASPENRWQEVLQPLLPTVWYPQSPEAVEGLYNGLLHGRQMGWGEILHNIPWSAWVRPLLVWGLFVLICYWVMFCIVSLLSRQALDNERMNFPLLRVPQMIEEALDQNSLDKLLLNRYLLAGLAIPVCLHLLNGLNFYFPQVPQIPTLILAGHYFSKEGLFSGFIKLKLYIYPAFIGFAFLASKQISFSFWFFFIAGTLLIGLLSTLGYNIPASALGITFGPTLSRPEETQMIGAYGVFFLFLAWLARHHFWTILRYAVGRGPKATALEDKQGEWFSMRFAFWGFVVGALLLIGWFWFFGLPPGTAVILLGAFFMVLLVASRVICQGGIAYFTLTAAPIDGLLAFFGPQFFSQIGLVVAGVVQKVLFVDMRESLMPSLVHARKVTQGVRRQGLLAGGIMVALAGAVIVSFLATLALCYKVGVRELQLDWATRTTVAVYDNLYSLVQTPVRPGEWVLIFAVVGALVMAVLVVCYHRVYWWPIHPIGYLTAYSSGMRILWFSFFVGWLFNSLCMRYGGVVLFKRMRYFFVGLIIGDFLMGGAWAIYGLFSYASYQVLPT